MARCDHGFIVAMFVGLMACGAPAGDLPEIEKPLDYGTFYVELPGCPVRLPPVHDVRRCSPDDIGVRLDAAEICRLLTGLKEWAGPQTWRFARSSCVYEAMVTRPPDDAGAARRVLTLYVEAPDRDEVWFAQQTDGQPEIDFFVSPR